MAVLMRHPEDPRPLVADGEWHGEILEAPRGENGFGYDPLFYLPDLEQTAAELDAALKNTLSHRGAAMRHARPAPGPSARMNERRVIPLVSAQPRAASTTIELAAPPPLSLYVHYPWCVRKCPYCDFNSHAVRDEGIPEEAYVEALVADLEAALPQIWGGGSTRFSSAEARPACCRPPASTACSPRCGPHHARAGRRDHRGQSRHRRGGPLQGLPRSRRDRVSLGIQSFNDTHLKALGRIHDASRGACRGRSCADSFRVGESRPDVRVARPEPGRRVRRPGGCDRLRPAHLSCYHLTLEPNTPSTPRRRRCPTTILPPTCRR